ncbi:MAG: hypothetical protein COT43_00725 [Candidatus Marinimicrobia bacterium CG08_land_8_20_14_0_20_45_22]|nr:MAG: hypothetical protein COT43_00725 [Candidatus Marinimicrobia bacterium CG08_land_8_20_14_0_20_45_22]
MRSDKTIYSIQIADVQTVAEQELDRKLTQDELKLVADAVQSDDYFGWYDGIIRIFQKLQLT